MSETSALQLREIRGPAAFDGDWRRLWHLSWYLAATELRRSYVEDRLGYLWTILRPLLLFGVLILVLRQVLRFGQRFEHYPQFLLLNIMLFTYFTDATASALGSIKAREQMARKMQFPRFALPASVVLTSTFTTAINMVVALVLIAVTGVEPRATWLLLPLLLIPLTLFVTGVILTLSAVYVQLTDIRQAWRLVARSLFYLTPVIYPIEAVPDSFRNVVASNPLAPILEQARIWVIDPDAPTITEAFNGPGGLLVPIAIACFLLVGGLWAFNRAAPRLAELP